MKRFGHPRLASRRGISLLEILISVGIVSIGLLAVASVIPVGGYYAEKGQRTDDAATLGKNAFQVFSIRGMRNTNNWVWWHSSANFPVAGAVGDPVSILPQGSSAVAGTLVISGLDSYAIDPRFIVTNPRDPPPSVPAVPVPIYVTFPYVPTTANTEPRMRRISLRQLPNFGILGAGPEANPNLGNGNDVVAEADEIFMTQDDLAISLPADTNLPPSSVGTDRRAFDGKLSWFATLVPRFSTSPAGSLLGSNGWYRLSIVVVNRRLLEASLFDGAERVVTIDQTLGPTGYSGGEVALQFTSSSDRPVRQGDWIMLGRKFQSINNIFDYSEFRWYRVVAADPEFDASNRQFVTLLGSDWNFDNSTSPPTYPTEATIVRGVTAVYEKTIRLEGASLW